MKKTQLLLLFLFFAVYSIDHLLAQAPVSAYSFSTSAGTYNPLGGTISIATGNDGVENGIPINFNFVLGKQVYTHFCISANGYIKLGYYNVTIGQADFNNNFSNSNTLGPLIAAFWDNNNVNTGSIRYYTTGSLGSRILTIDWDNVNVGGNGATSAVNKASFELRLFEVDNSISIIYAGTFAAAGALSGSIGLNDNASFLSVTPAAVPTVSSTTANNTVSNASLLQGKQYRFVPPASSCNAPPFLSVNNITSNQATVNIAVVSGATGYEYALTNSALPPVSGTTAASTSLQFSGLSQGTLYFVHVRTVCGAGTYSPWIAIPFTTSCNTNSIPYNQNFDAAVAPAFPVCTYTQSEQGAGTWLMSTAAPRSAPNCIRIVSDASQAESDWFYTNPMALTAGVSYRVSYYYKAGNAANQGFLNLLLQDVNHPNNNLVFGSNSFITNTSYQIAVSHFTPDSTSTYRIGFRGLSQNLPIDISLDDITVEQTPVCGEPTNLTVDFTTLTAATFSWTAPAQGSPVGYGYIYTTSAMPPLNGWFTTNTSESFNGLTPGVQYYLHVKSECQYGIFSNWVTIPFKTPCSARSVPYTENFDGITAPALPDCIVKQDLNAGTTWNTSTTGSRSAPNSMRYNYDTTRPANDWFYTAPIKLNGGTSYRLNFYYKARSSSFPEKLEVKYGNRNRATSMTNLLFTNSNIINTTYQLSSVDFTPAGTDSFYIGFHAFSIADRYDLNVDDISVDITPICGTASNLAVNLSSGTSGTASWSASTVGTIAGYQYTITNSVTPPLSGTATTNTSVPFSGLTPGQQYYLHVKTSCAAGIFSQWVTLPFNTTCSVFSIPYTENFDAVTFPAIPGCMSTEDLNGATTWTTDTAGSRSAPNSMVYQWDASLPGDDWFYTPPLALTAGTNYRLSFYYRARLSLYPERLEVKYGNANNAAAMGTLLFSNNNITSSSYQLAESDFTAPATGNFYIGFHAFSLPDQFELNVDDISVNLTPVCNIPFNLSVDLATDTSGLASWSPSNTSTTTAYEYIIDSLAGTPVANGNVTTDSFTIFNNLVAGRQYYLHVRSKCGAGISSWVTLAFTAEKNHTYKFTGNGNWSDAANWQNNLKPPAVLPDGDSIVIDHAAGGQCILDSTQHISGTSGIIVLTGKNLVIPGVLLIQ